MKKNYFKPSLIVVKADIENLLIIISGDDTGDSERVKPYPNNTGAKISWETEEESSEE